MARRILLQLLFSAFLLTTFAIPHNKRQDNETESLTAIRKTFDQIVSKEIRKLRLDYPFPLRLRGVQAEPIRGIPSWGATVFINITIHVYDDIGGKFLYTHNTNVRPSAWSDLEESSDQGWGDLEPWDWDEKQWDLRALMEYLAVQRGRRTLDAIWLEKPRFNWSGNGQLWWLCIPPPGNRHAFWVGDLDGVIMNDDLEEWSGGSQTEGGGSNTTSSVVDVS